MRILFYIFFPLLLSITPVKADETINAISFGPVQIGLEHIPIDLKNFKIHTKKSVAMAHFIPGSVQWIRTANNLLTPRARVKIALKNRKNISLEYGTANILPSYSNGEHTTEIYINLFNPGDVFIYEDQKRIDTITVSAKKSAAKHESHVIDYSCSRLGLQFIGLDDEYLSVGCRMDRTGEWGKEKPRLELTWSTTNYRLLNGNKPPFVSFLASNDPVEMTLIDNDGKHKKITIKAKLPKRLHRLKTALGFGPYAFKSHHGARSRDTELSAAGMLYGKLDFTPDTSLRFFDALVFNKSIFNNAGIYFAYKLADAFDNTLEIVPLLGLQGLSFKFDSDSPSSNQFIYPQGLEVVWKHAFGIKNYLVVYGMFLSTDSELTYDNLWVRWGKSYFWELNYIGWGEEDRKASMWGLSIGIPFLQFF